MTPTPPLDQLATQWREEAARYAGDGVPASAALLRRVAGEIEAAERAWTTEPLTLQQAAEELGVSYSTMHRWVRAGRIPNAGRKGAPRVRRCDLRRPGRRAR
jgi:excisionase family DNA binding protein